MNRRRFLCDGCLSIAAACTGSLPCAGAQARAALKGKPRLLDAHIHLFDPRRPEGITWPTPSDVIYKPALPDRYRTLAEPAGVLGAIAIEASPLQSDNDWVLGVIRDSTFMVGMVGDLVPTSPDFGAQLDRLRRDPLFLGIRHGNLWNRSLSADVQKSALWPALRQVEQAKLTFETANPDPALLKAVLRVAAACPNLTIVIDHLPHMQQPTTTQGKAELAGVLRDLAAAPHVFAKLSEIPSMEKGVLQMNPTQYRDRLDVLWNLFGENRVLFGSDWPNSDHVASLGDTLALVHAYLATKSEEQQNKFFFHNSQAAYRWLPRQHDQA